MTTTESTTSAAALPAAWYRDPSGRHERRWWDGRDWIDKVADGQTVSSDPPVRTQEPAAEVPAVKPEPAEPSEPAEQEVRFADTYPDTFSDTFSDTVVEDAAPPAEEVEDAAPAAEDVEGESEFERLGKKRVPIEERATTAPLSDRKINLRALPVAAVVLLIVGASAWWGVSNKSTAERWRDRGEELQDELVRSSSNADALEQALARSASRAAGLQDGQGTFTEVQGAARDAAQQLRECIDDVDGIITILSRNGDATDQLDRARASCSEASVGSDALIALLDAIAGP